MGPKTEPVHPLGSLPASVTSHSGLGKTTGKEVPETTLTCGSWVQALFLGKEAKRLGGEVEYSSVVEHLPHTSHSQGTEMATRVWLSPACPCPRKQAAPALLALGEHLERKVHGDP